MYVNIPEGVEASFPGKCLKLHKAIYGLKQAPRVWWLNLCETLEKHGFKPTFADQCLFIKQGKNGKIYILVYVDDILVAALKCEDVDDTIQIILEAYKATNKGEASSFLNLAITRDRSRRTLTLSQTAYIKEMAAKFGVDPASRLYTKPDAFPMAEFKDNRNRETDADEPCTDQRFGSLIGSLLYLANTTRPDISFSVSYLARFLHKPCVHHMSKAMKVLEYCVATMHQGITYGALCPG